MIPSVYAETVTATVTINDVILPIITVSGENPISIAYGSMYADAGATATDNKDGNITDSITTVNPVDTSKAGTYTITYDVTDSSANKAEQKSRTVIVKDTPPPVSKAFVTTWKIEESDKELVIPIDTRLGGYDYNVNWGDGTSTSHTAEASHKYEKAGTYTVSIAGNFPAIYLINNQDSADKLRTVEQWGDIKWSSMKMAFYGAKNMNVIATDAPDLSDVKSMRGMLVYAYSLDADLNKWDVSNVENMRAMFAYADSFNGDLNKWDVSNVENMKYMFYRADSFNGNISSWDVGNVKNMDYMFQYAFSFNGDLNKWDVSSVTDMSHMFQHASSFDGDISSWDVGRVTIMDKMFEGVDSFSTKNYDQLLSGWSSLDSLQNNVSLHVDSKYCDAGVAGKKTIVDKYKWRISDSGPDTDENCEKINSGSPSKVLLSQNFDSMESSLKPAADENITEKGWSHDAPAGWSIVSSEHTKNNGAEEWRGWSFVTPEFWQSADTQGRGAFLHGTGVIAVADPDEWDDLGNPSSTGTFNSTLSTPEIAVSGYDDIYLGFNSHYLQYGDQRGEVSISYDNGESMSMLNYGNSELSANSGAFSYDTYEQISLHIPPDTKTIKIHWTLDNAKNDWYWGIDNIQLSTGPIVPYQPRVLWSIPFTQNFDDMMPLLHEAVDESIEGKGWTHEAPDSWSIDNSGMASWPGVTEWQGWSFATKEFWQKTDAGQDRELFSRGSGVIAVADPDEWNDAGTPPTNYGKFDSTLYLPDLSVEGLDKVYLGFASHYKQEDDQTATVSASFDGRPAIEILKYSAHAGSDNKGGDVIDGYESIVIDIPPNFQTMKIYYTLDDAKNNWYWGIDNITVTEEAP